MTDILFTEPRPTPRQIALRLISGMVGGETSYHTAATDLLALHLTPDETGAFVTELAGMFVIVAALFSERIGAPVEDVVFLLERSLEGQDTQPDT
jgi:hypothetical protein